MLRTVPAARLAAAGWKGWNKMAKQITAIIVGAGHRALLYSTYALENPQALKIVGVADPDPIRRRKTAEMHGFGEDMCFESAEALSKHISSPNPCISAVFLRRMGSGSATPTILSACGFSSA